MAALIQTSSWSIVVAGVSYTFVVQSGRITLDDRQSIYGEATIVVSPIPDATLALLDPTNLDLRATITTTRVVTSPSSFTDTRNFNMVLLSRTRNPDDTVTLTLATDEAILAARSWVNTSPNDVGNSGSFTARGSINFILPFIIPGAALAAGAVDKSLPRLVALRNVVGSGSFETAAAVAGWGANVNASSVVQSSTQHKSGSFALRWTATAAGATNVTNSAKFPLDGTKLHRLMWSIRPTTTSTQITIRCFDASGTQVASFNVTPAFASTANAWNDYTYDFAAGVGSVPSTTTQIQVLFTTNSAAASALQYLDDVALYAIPDELRVPTPRTNPVQLGVALRFDGDATFWNGDTTDTANYDYSWEGTAHAPASVSVRAVLIDRDARMLILEPGENFRDFFNIISEAASGRMFCDEARTWRLVDDTYSVAGTITLDETSNVTELPVDTINVDEAVDGVPLNFTSVVLVYAYTDPTSGRTINGYDVAGSLATGRTYVRTIRGPFPGTGAAAILLARSLTRMHEMPVVAISDYTTTPGKALALTVRGDAWTGVVSSVQWRYDTGSGSDTMLVQAKSLA